MMFAFLESYLASGDELSNVLNFSILFNNFKRLRIMLYNDYIFLNYNTTFIELLFYKMEYYVTCDRDEQNYDNMIYKMI